MKLTKYLLGAGLAAMMTACDTCDMDPVIPPVEVPDAPAELAKANMTVLEFKQQYWSTQSNSMTQVGLTEEGDTIILRGRVVSTDVTGNFYKQLVLRDETGAITIPLGIDDIYKVYPYGTDMAVKVTGLYVGMYNNFMQLGAKEDDRTSPYQIPEEQLDSIFFPGGWPDPEAVQPLEADLEFLKTIRNDVIGRQEWQSQLVTISDVEFESPGQEFSPTYGSTVSQYVRDEKGNSLILRFSGRSSFTHRIIPTGKGSVTGILSFYGSNWQLIPCTLEDLKGFDDMSDYVKPEPIGDGSKESPYNVASAIANQNGTAWVKGYIVGSMYTPDGEYIFETEAPFHMNANVFLADSPDETVQARMFPVKLGNIRDQINLVNHPENLHKEIMIKGTLKAYFNQPGMQDCTAAILDGKEIGDASDPKPVVDVTCSRATTIADGTYALWFDGNKVAVPFAATANYGWLKVSDCTPAANGSITTSNANLFTFKKETKGWTIKDTAGHYLYQSGSYDSFQLTSTLDVNNDMSYWNITIEADGSAKIVNVGSKKTMLYSSNFNSAGAYADLSKGTAPYLYQPAK